MENLMIKKKILINLKPKQHNETTKGDESVARWTKKTLSFAISGAAQQIAFIDQIKRKLKLEYQIKADPRGVTLTLRGEPDRVRLTMRRIQEIFRALKEES